MHHELASRLWGVICLCNSSDLDFGEDRRRSFPYNLDICYTRRMPRSFRAGVQSFPCIPDMDGPSFGKLPFELSGPWVSFCLEAFLILMVHPHSYRSAS
jgi:hypothetical protein